MRKFPKTIFPMYENLLKIGTLIIKLIQNTDY